MTNGPPALNRPILPDQAVENLLQEPKEGTKGWNRAMFAGDENSVPLIGDRGHRFRLHGVSGGPSKYSIVLVYLDDPWEWRLCRVHGPARSRHRNQLENEVLPAGVRHVHLCTERYQRHRHKEDRFAIAVAPEVFDGQDQALQYVANRANIVTRGTTHGDLSLWMNP